ncbi:hypothetical protein CLF_108663, partial [Clonorchis sinensis]
TLNQSNVLLKDELQSALSVTLQHVCPDRTSSTDDLIKLLDGNISSPEEVRANYVKRLCSRLVALNEEKLALLAENTSLRESLTAKEREFSRQICGYCIKLAGIRESRSYNYYIACLAFFHVVFMNVCEHSYCGQKFDAIALKAKILTPWYSEVLMFNPQCRAKIFLMGRKVPIGKCSILDQVADASLTTRNIEMVLAQLEDGDTNPPDIVSASTTIGDLCTSLNSIYDRLSKLQLKPATSGGAEALSECPSAVSETKPEPRTMVSVGVLTCDDQFTSPGTPKTTVLEERHTHKPKILVFLDFQGAFYSFNRSVIVDTLAQPGMPQKVCKYTGLANLITNLICCKFRNQQTQIDKTDTCMRTGDSNVIRRSHHYRRRFNCQI